MLLLGPQTLDNKTRPFGDVRHGKGGLTNDTIGLVNGPMKEVDRVNSLGGNRTAYCMCPYNVSTVLGLGTCTCTYTALLVSLSGGPLKCFLYVLCMSWNGHVLGT